MFVRFKSGYLGRAPWSNTLGKFWVWAGCSDRFASGHCRAFGALEKETAAHCSALAWRVPGTGEPDGLQPMGSHRVGHDGSDLAAAADVGDGQGGLACCDSWGRKESDTTE